MGSTAATTGSSAASRRGGSASMLQPAGHATRLSRILFGSHFPSDVLGGVLLGYGSALLVAALLSSVGALERAGGRRSSAASASRESRTGGNERISPS